MEPITMADLKDLFAEFRAELRQMFAEEFGTCKPAVEAQTSGLQVAVDLLEQQDCRGKGNGLEEAPAADPLGPSATPAIVQRGPEVVLPASTEFIITTPTTCSMEGPSRDTTKSRSAPAPTPAPTVHTAAVDIGPMLAAPPASDGTINGEAISGVALTPATCSMSCLSQHPVAAPVLVASSPPTLTEHDLNTNIIPLAAVPLAMRAEFPAITAPANSTPTTQWQQFYNDSEFFMPIYGQCITNKAPVHRPRPWPSFMAVHADGVEARPWPWPSFGKINGGEFPSDPVEKAFQLCISVSCNAKEPQNYFCSFQPKESPILNPMTRSISSYDQFSCPNQYASCWLGDFFTSSQILVSDACSAWQLFLSAPSGSLKFLGHAQEPSGILPCVSKLAEVKPTGKFHEFEYQLNYMQNLRSLKLTWALEQEVLSCGFQLYWYMAIYLVHILFFLAALTIWPCTPVPSLSNILGEWHLVNQSIIARVCPDYPLKYNWLADTGRSWLLCVRSVCATVYKLWHIPWFSFLFLELTSEEPYRLALFQWEMTWQPNGEQYISFDSIWQSDVKIFEQARYVEFSGIIYLLVGVSASHAKEDNHSYFFCWDLGGSTLILFLGGELIQCLANSLLGAYQNWLATWTTGSSNADCTSFVCLTLQRILLGLNRHTSFPYWSIVVSSTIALQICSADMGLYCSSLYSSSDGTSCVSNKLELNNRVSYMVQQYTDLSYFGVQFGVPSFGKSTSRALTQGMSHSDKGSYRFHAKFLTNELSYEDNESRCHLCCYHPALFLFLAFDRQVLSQGGRCAMISIIRCLSHDNYNGLKVLQVSQNPDLCNAALSAAFQAVQLRVPWDPGGSEHLVSSTTTAWGQAVFQGGRGVSIPRDMGLHRYCQHGLGPLMCKQPLGNYIYTRRHDEEGIQVGSGENGTAASSSHLALILYLPSCFSSLAHLCLYP